MEVIVIQVNLYSNNEKVMLWVLSDIICWYRRQPACYPVRGSPAHQCMRDHLCPVHWGATPHGNNTTTTHCSAISMCNVQWTAHTYMPNINTHIFWIIVYGFDSGHRDIEVKEDYDRCSLPLHFDKCFSSEWQHKKWIDSWWSEQTRSTQSLAKAGLAKNIRRASNKNANFN